MRDASRLSTLVTTPAAGVLAVLAALAWVRLGPVVPVLVALPIFLVLLTAWRSAATALLLPLCLLPYAVRVGGVYVSVSDVLVVGLACCLAFAVAAGFEPHRPPNPLLAPALAFVAWTMASAVWAESPAKAMVDAIQRLEFTVFGVALMAALPTDGRHARRALAWLAAGAALLGIATVVVGVLEQRYLGVYPFGIHKNAAGSMISYGLLAAIGLRLAGLRRRGHGRWLAAAGMVTVAGLVVTGSRGAWVGALVALATVVAVRRPQLVWPVASITVVAVTLFLLVLPPETLGENLGFQQRYSTASVRAQTWTEGIETIAEHPLLGVGAGNFVAHFNGVSFQVDPNNLLLLTWAETGLPGLALLVWFLGACLRLAWRNARAWPEPGITSAANLFGVAMIVAAVVHAQFDMFWTRGTGLAAFLGVGLVVWSSRAIAAEARRPHPPAPTLTTTAWSRSP
jgi:O-antigen ligase